MRMRGEEAKRERRRHQRKREETGNRREMN